MVRYLVIVARDQADMCDYLTRQFSEDQAVQVLLDRRQRVRAPGSAPRPADRRRQPGLDALRSLGAVVARKHPEAPGI